MTVRIGVVAIQGAVSEHVAAIRRALDDTGKKGEVVEVRRAEHVDGLAGLIIPGGESTTIGKLMDRHGVTERVLDMAKDGLPIMGTCAGAILLASGGDDQVKRTGMRQLGLMEMTVGRNAFGRQRESFESFIAVEGMDGGPFPAVFIRAPAITRVWGTCGRLAVCEGRIVAARQDNLMALAFHPELTEDSRMHRLFLMSI